MMRCYPAGALALVIAVHLSAWAQVPRDVAEDLMRKSGLWEQLGSIEKQIDVALASTLDADSKNITPAERARLASAFKSAYAPSHLRSTALAVLSKEIEAGQVAALTDWYGSPDGVAITRVEEAGAASARDPRETMAEGAKAYATAHESRQAQTRRLVQASHAAEFSAAVIVNARIGILQGLAAAQPSRPSPPIAELRTALEKQRPQLMQTLTNYMIASFTMAYSTITDESLERYLGFLDSADGARFITISIRGLEAAFAEAARDFGRSLPATRDGANS